MLRTKFLKKSRKAFEEIDEKGIQNQLSKYWKAVMYCYMDEIDNALDAIQECYEKKPHWDIKSWEAYALKRQEKYKEAIKVADQVLKDYPESWVIATKLDALFWSGDLLEWKRVDLKYEEKSWTVSGPIDTPICLSVRVFVSVRSPWKSVLSVLFKNFSDTSASIKIWVESPFP